MSLLPGLGPCSDPDDPCDDCMGRISRPIGKSTDKAPGAWAWFVALLIVIAVCVLATAALAQSNCGSASIIKQRLAEEYDEAILGIGVQEGGVGTIEVWRNRHSGTWTVLRTLPDGRLCVLDSGDGWEDINDPIPNKGDPA